MGKGPKMPVLKRKFIPNQVFLGLPWKNVRPKYERIMADLAKKYAIHFTIVGRGDGQVAEDLLELIKDRISTSSVAIFDATGGNANVSLEYGFAEGTHVPKAIFLSTHKAAQTNPSSPIIADLGGKKRVEYKNEATLAANLQIFCKDHDYTKRFETGLAKIVRRLTKGEKKSRRALALKLIHGLSGAVEVRRVDLIQRLQAQGYSAKQVEEMITKLKDVGLITSRVGRYSTISVA
jgi:hypothetical protein